MTDAWDDPVAWRDAMLPPLSFSEALKAARKAKATRFVWRGATFDLSEPVAKETATPARSSVVELRGEPDDEVEAWIKKQAAHAD